LGGNKEKRKRDTKPCNKIKRRRVLLLLLL